MYNVLKEYDKWKKEPSLSKKLKEDLVAIEDDLTEIEDRFYKLLSFGTGGMRGLLGAGTNRVNIYTIRHVAEGLALFILDAGKDATRRGIAISYDTRHCSQEFALEVAKTIGKYGISVYLFKESRPTPELSFAIRHLGAYAGVMITASHNPRQYNGIKVYGKDGGQLPPAAADGIVRHMEDIKDLFAIRVKEEVELVENGILAYLMNEIDMAYQRRLLSLIENKDILKKYANDLSIIFTPLHGSGLIPITDGLRSFGFNHVTVVQEQAAPNPEFPTVSYPNPEEKEVFELAIKLGRKIGAELLLATDPDADRLGVAVRKSDKEYMLLSGNQLGAILLHYLLLQKQQKGELPFNGFVAKTIVTSELGRAISTKFGMQTINTLTGFKFISEKIEEFNSSGQYTFLFGYEESYGYLIGDFVRDKDAVQAALLTAEMTAYYKSKGKTLDDALNDLDKEFGYYRESSHSLTFEGKEGHSKIERIMSAFRNHPPKSICTIPVLAIEDYKLRTRQFSSGISEPLTLPEADVIKLFLEDDSWICIRPSGTEPKCKFYFGVQKNDRVSAEDTLRMMKQDLIEMISWIE
jgi:phosphoglucomutase